MAAITGRTTGWTNETRDLFHPGDVIATIKMYYTGFSPYNGLGVTELVCHVTGKGREFYQPNISETGQVSGFNTNILPKILKCQLYLREQFPKLAAFADNQNTVNLDRLYPDKYEKLIKKVEQTFGKTIEVRPMVNQLPSKL